MVSSRLLAAAFVFCVCAHARADDPSEGVFRFFQEESQSSTPLRHLAPSDRSPLAVDVVTAADLKASGALDIWDVLRFRVGLDVLEGRSSAGTDRAVVSVRGMSRDTVSELQVLVDGRSVYSPLSGGVLWSHLPVQLQDVERIEIVRGPNAALYGSNAGLGVINIITRRPSTTAAATTVRAGSLNLRQGAASVERAGRTWGLGFSAADRAQDGFPRADGAGQGNDWLHAQNANIRAWTKPTPETEVELLAGVAREGHGENLDASPQERGLNDFQSVHVAHSLNGGSSADLRISRTADDTVSDPDINGLRQDTRYWQYDAEALHSVPWAGGRLRTTYGASWRYAAASSNELFGPNVGVVTNRTVRGFLHQEIRLTDSLDLLGGVSNETANAGGYHKDFQVAALWTPAPDQSLRASYSRANTMPGLLHRDANLQAGPFVSLVGSRTLKPSPLTDYEAGWTGRFLERALTAELTGFYMYVQDHVNLDPLSTAPYVLTYDNTNTIQLRGLEASLKWRFAQGSSLYANLTRETVTDQDGHSLYIDTTPKNKVNLGADATLPAGLRLSANAGYKDVYLADSNTGTAQYHVGAYWRLDARLGLTIRPGVELFAAGRNLLAPSRREYVDGLAVPREIDAGVTWRY